MISSYSDLQSAIVAWLNRADLSDRAGDFISLAEADFRRQLVMPDMEVTIPLTGDYSIPLPDDFDSLRSLASLDTPELTVQAVSIADFNNLQNARTGVPSYYTVDGGSIYIWPTPDANASFSLSYRASLPSLSSDTPSNWLLTKHPDVYLFGSLLQAEFFGWNDERLPIIQQKLQATIEDVNRAGQRQRYGGPLIQRANVTDVSYGRRFVSKW